MRNFTANLISLIVIVAVVIGATAILSNHYIQTEKQTLAPLQEQNESLRSQIDENRRDLEATAQLLRTAVNHANEGGLFASGSELNEVNTQRMNALADAIAQRIEPKLPPVPSADELARQEDQQIDKISSATAQKLQPSIQQLTDAQSNANSQELAQARDENARLRQSLDTTEKAADDALALTNQLSSQYLATYQQKGALVRIFALPGEIIQDAASGDVVNGNHTRKAEQAQLDAKIKQIQQRLNQIRDEVNQPVASNG